MRANLKVPPRFPHKVEASLLHPRGNDSVLLNFLDLVEFTVVQCLHFAKGLLFVTIYLIWELGPTIRH